MAFGGQMHHRLGFVPGQNTVKRNTITDICLHKLVTLTAGDLSHGFQIAGIR